MQFLTKYRSSLSPILQMVNRTSPSHVVGVERDMGGRVGSSPLPPLPLLFAPTSEAEHQRRTSVKQKYYRLSNSVSLVMIRVRGDGFEAQSEKEKQVVVLLHLA